MKKMFWIIGAAAVVLVAAVAVFAMQPKGAGGVFSMPILGAARINVPQGTVLAMRLQTTLSTKTTNVGDRFEAGVSSPVNVNGKLAIPEGAQVSGHVILAKQPGKTSGRGQLQLAYDQVRFDGRSYDLGSRSQIYESKSGTTGDVAMIGGGAVAGGIVGAVLGGGGGAVKGAVIGGAAGTGASLLTRGPQLELGRGTALQVRLDQAVSVRAPKATV